MRIKKVVKRHIPAVGRSRHGTTMKGNSTSTGKNMEIGNGYTAMGILRQPQHLETIL